MAPDPKRYTVVVGKLFINFLISPVKRLWLIDFRGLGLSLRIYMLSDFQIVATTILLFILGGYHNKKIQDASLA